MPRTRNIIGGSRSLATSDERAEWAKTPKPSYFPLRPGWNPFNAPDHEFDIEDPRKGWSEKHASSSSKSSSFAQQFPMFAKLAKNSNTKSLATSASSPASKRQPATSSSSSSSSGADQTDNLCPKQTNGSNSSSKKRFSIFSRKSEAKTSAASTESFTTQRRHAISVEPTEIKTDNEDTTSTFTTREFDTTTKTAILATTDTTLRVRTATIEKTTDIKATIEDRTLPLTTTLSNTSTIRAPTVIRIPPPGPEPVFTDTPIASTRCTTCNFPFQVIHRQYLSFPYSLPTTLSRETTPSERAKAGDINMGAARVESESVIIKSKSSGGGGGGGEREGEEYTIHELGKDCEGYMDKQNKTPTTATTQNNLNIFSLADQLSSHDLSKEQEGAYQGRWTTVQRNAPWKSLPGTEPSHERIMLKTMRKNHLCRREKVVVVDCPGWCGLGEFEIWYVVWKVRDEYPVNKNEVGWGWREKRDVVLPFWVSATLEVKVGVKSEEVVGKGKGVLRWFGEGVRGEMEGSEEEIEDRDHPLNWGNVSPRSGSPDPGWRASKTEELADRNSSDIKRASAAGAAKKSASAARR